MREYLLTMLLAGILAIFVGSLAKGVVGTAFERAMKPFEVAQQAGSK